MDKENKNELIVVKETIFDKIKKFFKNLFSKKQEVIEEKDKEKENEFMNRVKAEESNEEKRLKKLQNLLLQEVITEEEIPDSDIKALHEMYDKRILELKNEIYEYREKILRLRANAS